MRTKQCVSVLLRIFSSVYEWTFRPLDCHLNWWFVPFVGWFGFSRRTKKKNKPKQKQQQRIWIICVDMIQNTYGDINIMTVWTICSWYQIYTIYIQANDNSYAKKCIILTCHAIWIFLLFIFVFFFLCGNKIIQYVQNSNSSIDRIDMWCICVLLSNLCLIYTLYVCAASGIRRCTWIIMCPYLHRITWFVQLIAFTYIDNWWFRLSMSVSNICVHYVSITNLRRSVLIIAI